jgi:hypothetical protein
VLAATAAALLVLWGCHGSSRTGTPADSSVTAPGVFTLGGSHQYHYYPEAQVYYSPQRDLYFWPGAAYWGVGQRVPSTYKLEPQTMREIRLDTDKPYRVHAQVSALFTDGSGTTGPLASGAPTDH